jgi:hypothetical protein
MADYAHQLALDAMLREGPGLTQEIRGLMDLAKKQREEEG